MASDPKSAWILGYSRYRILFIAASLIGIFGFVILRDLFVKRPHWGDRFSKTTQSLREKKIVRISIWVILISVWIIGIAAAWIGLKEHWTIWVNPPVYLLGDYLRRLVPLLFWLIALSTQSMVALWQLVVRVRLVLLILQVISVMLFPGLLLFFSALHPNVYRIINREDYIIEWLTVLFFLLAAITAIVLGFLIKRKGSPYPIFLILFAGGCILFAVEEISWGQRILNVESPEYFIEHSDQQEINVHNIISERFSIKIKHVAAWVMFAYGVALPIAVIKKPVRSIVEKLKIVVPAAVLIPGFLIACILTSDRYFTGLEEEVAEFFFSTLLFLTLVLNFWKINNQDSERKILVQHQ
jgi:hypothetical protein